MRRKTTRKRKAAAPRRKTTRRRRRISGIGSTDVQGMAMKALGLVAGACAGRELNTLIVKMVPSFPPKMSGLAQMAVGFVLPMMVKNNKFIADMGAGMIANGGMVEVVNLGLISGMGNNPSKITYRINGTGGRGSLNAINGTGNLSAVSGLSTVSGVNRRKVSGPRCY
jgi:hypothetical protein